MLRTQAQPRSRLSACGRVGQREAAEAFRARIAGSEGVPMIRHVNEAIERTAQLTGQSAEEVVRRWIMEDAPPYGVVSLLGAGAIKSQREEVWASGRGHTNRLRGTHWHYLTTNPIPQTQM